MKSLFIGLGMLVSFMGTANAQSDSTDFNFQAAQQNLQGVVQKVSPDSQKTGAWCGLFSGSPNSFYGFTTWSIIKSCVASDGSTSRLGPPFRYNVPMLGSGGRLYSGTISGSIVCPTGYALNTFQGGSNATPTSPESMGSVSTYYGSCLKT